MDTYKSGVASAAIAAGADLINDIWGLKADKKMAEVIAKAKLPSCLMHNRETMDYNNFLEDVVSDLQETLNIAKKKQEFQRIPLYSILVLVLQKL